VTLAAVLLVAGAREAGACSHPLPEPVFVLKRHPGFPLQAFAGGRLGIVLPTWDGAYLIVAYRHLAGMGVDDGERQALLRAWERRLGRPAVGKPPDEVAETPLDDWVGALAELGLRPPALPARDRFGTGYSSFVNCLDDAFATAAKTLRARAARYGKASPLLREWAAAQHVVFGNCGGDPVRGYANATPATLPDSADPLARADRAYQVASALFYAGRFEEASAAFRAIASDAASPWRVLARHLVARCLIRRATLAGGILDLTALAAAELQLHEILADPGLAEVHPASERLLRFVRGRLSPRAACEAAAGALVRPHAGATLALDVEDYLRYCRSGPSNDLAAWLRVVGSSTEPGESRDRHLATALERWRAGEAPEWGLAALLAARPDSPSIEEALAAGRSLEGHPVAGATAAYHTARLELARGEVASARERLERLLAFGEQRLGRATWNLALSLRLQAASGLDDFLRHAGRRPAHWVWPELSDEVPDTERGDDSFRLDEDTAWVLSWLPLTMQVEAVAGDALPTSYRLQLGGAAWVKAVALGEDDAALLLARRLVELRPESAALLGRFLRAGGPSARAHEALVLLLDRSHPPVVLPLKSLVGGLAPPPEDLARTWFRDWDAVGAAWPCGVARRSGCEPVWTGEAVSKSLPPFLGNAERAAARREWERLEAVGSGPEFFAASALAWADAAPSDPRVPRALHRAVASTRWACESDRVADLSRRAFRRLHARYSRTEWAQRTPYWYRGR
jgi:hypothetical protein